VGGKHGVLVGAEENNCLLESMEKTGKEGGTVGSSGGSVKRCAKEASLNKTEALTGGAILPHGHIALDPDSSRC